MLLGATFFDAVFVILLATLILNVVYLRERRWYSLILGFFAAFLIEKYALQTNRWAYNGFMPIIPILNTGLTPTIQLGILSYIVMKIADKKERKPFQCPECGLNYKGRGWAEKCENWCREHKSCNIENTRHSLDSNVNPHG
ncbi:MAG: hypothetical protein HY506_02725 [Candidatus Yanofskybacteria bacterium]|nr:hypothetical protein [Candidatus Yanofskybacteria bacterium]